MGVATRAFKGITKMHGLAITSGKMNHRTPFLRMVEEKCLCKYARIRRQGASPRSAIYNICNFMPLKPRYTIFKDDSLNNFPTYFKDL